MRRLHLDTVFTFCDREVVTVFKDMVDPIRRFSAHPTGDDGAFEVREDKGH